MTKKEISEKIVQSRNEKGWTINKLAVESKVQSTQLKGIESGEKSPTIDTFLQIIDALGLEIILQEKFSSEK